MSRFRVPLVVAAALAATGPSMAADEAPRRATPCAFVSQIDYFRDVDDYTAIIQTSPSRRYKVTFFNRCREMRWAFAARVESRPGICLSRGDVIVFGRHRAFQDRCIIDRIELLPPKGQATPAASPY
jgi:hypothetical protein